MEPTKRTRVHREPLPLNALTVEGEVDAGQVPNSRRQSGERKWQSLATQIRDISRRGHWLVVTLNAGHDPDVVRSGLKEELKRYNARLEWRLVRQDDDSVTMYFSAKDNHATSTSDYT